MAERTGGASVWHSLCPFSYTAYIYIFSSSSHIQVLTKGIFYVLRYGEVILGYKWFILIFMLTKTAHLQPVIHRLSALITKEKGALTRTNVHVKNKDQEKDMATYSSIVTWKSPETEEPAGLQSMGWHVWACVHEGGARWVGSNKLVELKKKRLNALLLGTPVLVLLQQ